MARYIDVEKATRHLMGACVAKYPSSFYSGIFASADEIDKMPTADVVEVKRGKWNEDGRCSNCDWYMPFDSEGNAFETLYCPHCGSEQSIKT